MSFLKRKIIICIDSLIVFIKMFLLSFFLWPSAVFPYTREELLPSYNEIDSFSSYAQKWSWLIDMSVRLRRWIVNPEERIQFLTAVHKESIRFGLDPQFVLAVIQVESGFKKYAVSSTGAQGYMQIMPFWRKFIGSSKDNLFDLHTSIRYGCLILRYYIDQEKGDVLRALQRYNGSKGSIDYPYRVWSSWVMFWK
ncbi:MULTISPECIES: lytic transglycosylase domain-containing protein [Candidatus Ichthyocystis]|uniref:Putative transglycosylase n=1 Tax=Candidatus Ichthyocystis hellenicum TaxID=1561003 RepID=A0A0S4M0Z0_9BURK|nr:MULTISPECIES: lytic transglycosylase domain-containing protein [Ichthyocystis]CUT17281.1 putative transglycosylase [Candidatus Ichthyocystis hellenicum]